MNELRRRAIALARAAKRQEDITAFFDLMAELTRILETVRGDVHDIQIRMGALQGRLTSLVGQETEERIAPLALQIERLAEEVLQLQERTGALERAVGDPDPSRSLGGEG